MRECDNCGRISEDSRFLKPQQHVPQCFLIIESKYLQESPASQLFVVSTPVKSCDVSFYNEETSQKVTFDLPKIIGGANHNSTNRRDVSSTSSQLHLRPLPNERLNLFLPSRELYMRERALQQMESAALNERVIADTRKDIALIRDMLRSAITARPLKEKQHDRPNHDETLPPAKVRKAETGKWEKELFDGFGEAADADAVDQLLNSGEATRNRDREEVCVIEFNRMVKTSSLCVGKYGLNIKGIEDMDITAPATEFTVCVEEYKVVSSQGPRVLHEVRHRLYRSINMKREHNKSFDASFGQPVEFFVTECNDLHVFIIHLLYRGRLFAWSSVNALYEGPWVSKLRKPPVDMAVALVVEHINLDDPILRGFISDKASDDLGEAEAYLNRLESQPPATNKTVENMNDPSVSAVNLRPRMSAKTGVDKASETIQHTKTQRQNYDENGKVVLAASPVPPVTKKSFSHKEERESTSPSGPQNSTATLKPYPREYREERETTSPSDPQNSTATLKPYPREYREERKTTSPSDPQNSTATLKPYPREYKEERETTSPSDPQNSTATLKPYPREYREERETTSPSDPQNSTATLKPYPREYKEERESTSPSDPQNSTATLKPYPREYREERETTSPSDPQNSTATLKPYPREYKEERETTSPSDPQNSTATLKPYPREYKEERESTSPSDPQNSTATLRRFRRGGMDGRDGRDHTGAVTCQSNGGCVSSKGESSDTKTNGASGTRNRGRNNDGNGDKITGGSGSQKFPVEERVSPLSACVLLGLRSEGDVPSSRKIGSEREGFASVDLRVNKIVGLPPNCLCARVLVYFVNYISRQTKGLVNDSSDCELFMRPPNAIGYQKSGGNGTSPTFDIKFDDIMVTNNTYAIVIIEYITNPKCGPTTFGHVSLPIHTLAPVGNFLSRIRLGDPREPEARSVHVDRLSGPTSILTSYRSSKQRQHAVAEGKFDAAALYDKLLQPLKSRAECHPCGFISWCVGSDPNAPSFEYPGEPPLSNGEVELFSVREALDTSKSFHYTDIGEPMRAFGQQRSQSFRDFSSIVPYDPNRGFFILTEAVHGMCTREALYVVVTSINVNGHNNIAYTKKFRWSSDVGAPHFDDPIKAIRMVKAHPFTVAEKYLLRITNLDTIPKYEGRQLLVEQVGWTLLKMFPEDGAVRTGRYALALFEGTPPPQLLDEVKSYPMDEVLSYWVLSNRVQYITPPASVVVSIGDICFAEQFSVDHPGRPQPQKLMTTKHQEISLPCVGNEGSMGYKQDDLLKDMGISVEKAESAIRTALKSFLHRIIQRRREKYGKKDVRFVDGE